MQRTWVVALVALAVIVSGQDVTITGSSSRASVAYTSTSLVNPGTVFLSDSTLGPITVSGKISGAVINLLRCVIANVTVIGTFNASTLWIYRGIIGDQFTASNWAAASEWVFVQPTTAVYFSSPVQYSKVTITDVALTSTARGVHFASVVAYSTIDIVGGAFNVTCLNWTAPVSNLTSLCGNVYALSSDYAVDATQVSVNGTSLSTSSDFGGANGVYLVTVGRGTSVSVFNATITTTSNADACEQGFATVAMVATGVRLLSVTAASVTLESVSIRASSDTACAASGIVTGAVRDAVVVISRSSVNAQSTSATAAVAALSMDATVTTQMTVTASALACYPAALCAAVRWASFNGGTMRVSGSTNVTSSGSCFEFAAQSLAVLLFENNTMWCSLYFVRTPSLWGPFVSPLQYFVGRCNTADGVEVQAATLPALVPALMSIVACPTCSIALDCNAPATESVVGITGSCRCNCKASYLNTVVFHRKPVSSVCNFLSISTSKSRSDSRSGRSASTEVSASISQSPSRPSSTRSPTADATDSRRTPTLTYLATRSPTRTKTLLPTPSATFTTTVPYVPPPGVVLAESLAARMPTALFISAIAASALAGFYSPTLSNKASTIARVLTSVDCTESPDKYKPIVFLRVFSIGSDVSSRLLGASVFAASIASVSLAVAHGLHTLATTPTDLALPRRLSGHIFAFCFTLLVPYSAEYAATSLSHSSFGRPIALVVMFLVIAVGGFAFFHVLVLFPRRRSRPRTVAMRQYKEEKRLRLRHGAPMPEQGGDPIQLPMNVPYIDEPTTLNVEEDSEEEKRDEARWKSVADRIAAEEATRAKRQPADAEAEVKMALGRMKRRKRHRKRQRHWSVWHSWRFTATLYGLYFEARDYRARIVRLYFFEDWLFATLVALNSGLLPGAKGCGAIAAINAIFAALHMGYLFAVRPFRHSVSAALSMLMATGLAALAVCSYFATTTTSLIDVAVQIAVVLTGVLVVHVVLVGITATVRFFRRATTSDEVIPSDQDSEEIEEKKRAAEMQRLALARMLTGADGDEPRSLLDLERVATARSADTRAGDLIFHGNEGTFGRGKPPPPPPDDIATDEDDGAIGDETAAERRRRRRLQYPHYVERPMCTHDESVSRFIDDLKHRASSPLAAGKDDASASPRTMVGGTLGFVSTARRRALLDTDEAYAAAPLMSPLVLLDRQTKSASRPRPITDDDYDTLKRRPFGASDDSSSESDVAASKKKAKGVKKDGAKQTKKKGFASFFHSRDESKSGAAKKAEQAPAVISASSRYTVVSSKPARPLADDPNL